MPPWDGAADAIVGSGAPNRPRDNQTVLNSCTGHGRAQTSTDMHDKPRHMAAPVILLVMNKRCGTGETLEQDVCLAIAEAIDKTISAARKDRGSKARGERNQG